MRVWRVLAFLAGCAPSQAQFTAPPFQPDNAQLSTAELRDVLGLLCPGQEKLGQNAGCRVCPPSSETPGARADASIVSAVRGHFLKPDSDDLLLDLYGCGATLLTHSSSGWYVSQGKGLPDGPCRKVAGREGRDGLVCYTVTATPDQEAARLTFSSLGDTNVELLAAFDNTGGTCDAPKRVVVQSAIGDVKFVPGSGGKLSVTITARCRRGPLSERSQKACARGPGFEDIGPVAPFRSFRIEYAFSGDGFALSPASRQLKQAYDACSAEPK